MFTQKKILLVAGFLLLSLSACTEEKIEKGTHASPSMSKCGIGKCGANMFDDNAALTKKKKNLLSQMSKDDKRRDCIEKSTNTKDAYNCVRDPQTKKLSLKCGAKAMQAMPMKCGVGKCGQ